MDGPNEGGLLGLRNIWLLNENVWVLLCKFIYMHVPVFMVSMEY